MIQKSQIKVIIALFLLIAAVVVVFYLRYYADRSDQIDPREIPAIIPLSAQRSNDQRDHFYLPSDAEWIAGEEYKFEDGRGGESVTYKSTRSPSDLYDQYQNFLNTNRQWVIDEKRTLEGDKYFLLAHQKDWSGDMPSVVLFFERTSDSQFTIFKIDFIRINKSSTFLRGIKPRNKLQDILEGAG